MSSTLEIEKKRYSSLLIISIFSSQLLTSAIVYGMAEIHSFSMIWIAIYYGLNFFAAIPQAGFSDFYGRKRHLIIASIGILLASCWLIIAYFNREWLALLPAWGSNLISVFPICLILGISGNAIPIARAGLADLKIHDFRTAMGWSTIFIGFGWVIAVLLRFILPVGGVLIFTVLIQVINVLLLIKYFRDKEDQHHHKGYNQGVGASITTSFKWVGAMCSISGGLSAVIAYLFTETTFWQIYSVNEEMHLGEAAQVIGVLMAFGYAAGVVILWIVSCSDRKGIEAGILISMGSLAVLLADEIFHVSDTFSMLGYKELFKGFLEVCFAFGFGFFVPCLFSLMSKKMSPDHAGRLFGVIDSTDTLALGLSFSLLTFSNQLNISSLWVLVFMLILFVIAGIFYLIFIKRFHGYGNSDKELKK